MHIRKLNQTPTPHSTLHFPQHPLSSHIARILNTRIQLKHDNIYKHKPKLKTDTELYNVIELYTHS